IVEAAPTAVSLADKGSKSTSLGGICLAKSAHTVVSPVAGPSLLSYTRGNPRFRLDVQFHVTSRNFLNGFGRRSAKVQCRAGGVGLSRRRRWRPDRSGARLCLQQGSELGAAGVGH